MLKDKIELWEKINRTTLPPCKKCKYYMADLTKSYHCCKALDKMTTCIFEEEMKAWEKETKWDVFQRWKRSWDLEALLNGENPI